MENRTLDFFLGALSPTGFDGYYTQLIRNTNSHVFLLKGSPGCGKSTLLKRIGSHLLEQNETIEAIHCSADPNSLDAVICANRNFAIADATSPHTLEPIYPLAFEQIMPLYYCIDAIQLHSSKDELIVLFDRYAALNERATRYLSAAGSLLKDTARTAQTFTNAAKAHDLAMALSKKYLPNSQNIIEEKESAVSFTASVSNYGTSTHKNEQIRLLSATTHTGIVYFTSTIQKIADTVIRLDDPFGYAAKTMLYTLRSEALEKGYKIITCYCSMSPFDKIEHILIPELRLAFITHNEYHKFENEGSSLKMRTIHCTRFCNANGLQARRKRMQFNSKAITELLNQAYKLMEEAKACHDELEQYYINSANFKLLDKAYDKITHQLEIANQSNA